MKAEAIMERAGVTADLVYVAKTVAALAGVEIPSGNYTLRFNSAARIVNVYYDGKLQASPTFEQIEEFVNGSEEDRASLEDCPGADPEPAGIPG